MYRFIEVDGVIGTLVYCIGTPLALIVTLLLCLGCYAYVQIKISI